MKLRWSSDLFIHRGRWYGLRIQTGSSHAFSNVISTTPSVCFYWYLIFCWYVFIIWCLVASIVSDSLRPHGPGLPGSSVGFSRQEYWSGLSCSPPGDLPNPGISPASPVSPVLKSDSLLLSQWGGHTSCFSIRLKIQNKSFLHFFHPPVLLNMLYLIWFQYSLKMF